MKGLDPRFGGSEFNQGGLKFEYTFCATSYLFPNGLSPATFQVVAHASMASVCRKVTLCIVTNKEGLMTLTCFALYLFFDSVLQEFDTLRQNTLYY